MGAGPAARTHGGSLSQASLSSRPRPALHSACRSPTLRLTLTAAAPAAPWERGLIARRRRAAPAVDISVEARLDNSRNISASVDVPAPVEAVWAVLTEYERLGDFIPGLVENRCLARRASGCRLLQVGAQDLALGLKFTARCVLEIREHPRGLPDAAAPAAPSLFPALLPDLGALFGAGSRGSSDSGSSSSGSDSDGGDGARFPRPRPRRGAAASSQRRDITFEAVDGDFQIFRGMWRLEPGLEGPQSTRLSYSLFVRPQVWLPVALVESRIVSEIRANLLAVKNYVQLRR